MKVSVDHEVSPAAQADYTARILSALSIPTDAAALAERDKRVRDEVLAECLDRIKKLRGEGWDSAPSVHPYDKGYLAAIDAVRNKIRAMTAKGGE